MKQSRRFCFKDPRTILLIIVYIGQFMDYSLMQSVVPIMPEYLIRLGNPRNATMFLNAQNGTDDPNSSERHRFIETTGISFSILYAGRSIVRVLVGPIAGTFINRVGYSIPLFSGFIIMTASAITFAFGQTYSILLIARLVHGIGSSFTASAGMGLLAEVYNEEKARSKALGIALGGLSLGGLVGAPYGGVMYHCFGKELPFLLLGGLGFIGAGLLLVSLPPRMDSKETAREKKPSSVWKLLTDPYIAIALSGIFFSYFGWSSLQPALQFRMIDLWGAKTIQRGFVFMPSSFLYVIATNFLSAITMKFKRWRTSLVGLVALGVCFVVIAFVPSIWFFPIPFTICGLSMGLIDTGLYFLLGHFVELRHQKAYGPVYALAESTYSLAAVIGPVPSGKVVALIGFENMCYILGAVTVASAPLMVFLRKYPVTIMKEEIEAESPNSLVSSTKK